MKQKVYYIILLLSFLAFTYPLSETFSYPKFAAYTGEKCMSCHVNPTGGGLRQMYGIKYSKDNLYLKILEKVNKEAEFNTQLTKGIQVGGDMRLGAFRNQQGEGQPDLNTFFQMQGDLYVNAKLNKYLNITIAPSLQYLNFPPVYEIYGMVSNLPAGLYFKAGKFKPNFGIRIPEHRAYQRLYNFNAPYDPEAGLEVGISPSYFTLNVGLFNGLNNNARSDFDIDGGKEIVASGDFRWASKKNKFTVGVGGSFLNNPFKFNVQENINAVRQIAAGFISIGLFERIAVLGELDYNRLDIRDSAKRRNDFKTIFGEVDIRVIKGLEVKFQFEDYNPQLGNKTGSLKLRRYSFGVIVYPLTGLEIEAIYRLVQEPGLKEQSPESEIKNNEYQAVFKFYF